MKHIDWPASLRHPENGQFAYHNDNPVAFPFHLSHQIDPERNYEQTQLADEPWET